MSYKKSKSIKHRVIGSLFRVLVFITRTGHQLVKGRGAQIIFRGGGGVKYELVVKYPENLGDWKNLLLF